MVSDPPYHISFMGKSWDAEGAGIAFSLTMWDEVYRVLRPGGVVKAFSGTRTFHRMTAAMAEVGFRDLRLEAWTYGSGFPKSMSIGKALDKAAGAEREVVGWNAAARIAAGSNKRRHEHGTRPSEYYQGTGCAITTPTTKEARQWTSWGTALKPSWEPVVWGGNRNDADVDFTVWDCVKVLREYEEGSVGAVVCDPPYDLTMVSRGGSSRQFVDNPYGRARVGTDRKGFMGKTWDGTGIAFSLTLWDEIYRVLRPGGIVKAFSGTRTFHRWQRRWSRLASLGSGWKHGPTEVGSQNP